MIINYDDYVKHDVYLKHYGVPGMKWGVRNERKSSGKKPRSSKVGLTPEQSMLAMYGAVAAIAVISKANRTINDSGRKDAKRTGDRPFKENPALKRKMSVETLHSKVVIPINPGYGEPGTKMNCRRATMAYEMRRRGYDVKATKSAFATGQTEHGLKSVLGDKKQKFESPWGEKSIDIGNGELVKGFKTIPPHKKANAIFDALATNPSGSRGELGVAWSMGGGHSMAWEVVGRKPVIFDTQNGKIYDSPKSFIKMADTTYEAAHTRLDNKPIDDELIKRWVTDV